MRVPQYVADGLSPHSCSAGPGIPSKFSSWAIVMGEDPLRAMLKILRRCGHSLGFGTRRLSFMTFVPREVLISFSNSFHLYPYGVLTTMTFPVRLLPAGCPWFLCLSAGNFSRW